MFQGSSKSKNLQLQPKKIVVMDNFVGKSDISSHLIAHWSEFKSKIFTKKHVTLAEK